MKTSTLIKGAGVAAMIALGNLAFAHDALAWGRFRDGHHAQGKPSAGKTDDQNRRVKRYPPATVCRCSELACCDGD
jgi:hypothetical protein